MRNINDFIKNPTHKLISEAYEKAKTPEEMKAAEEYQLQLQAAMTPEEKAVFDKEFEEDCWRMLSVIEEDIADLRAEALRKKMGEMPKFVNLSQIARVYFGKSQSWLMQRINGNKVNGKEARFTPAEAKQLEAAFHDLGRKFLALSL